MSSQKPLIQTKLSFSRTDSSDSQSSLKRKHSGSTESEETTMSYGAAGHSEIPRYSKPNSEPQEMQSDYGRKKLSRLQSNEAPEDPEDSEPNIQEEPKHESDDDEEDRNSYGSHESDIEFVDNNLSDDNLDLQDWGCPFDDLPKAPECFRKPLPILRDHPPYHYVYFIPTDKLKEAKEFPRSHPGDFFDNWDRVDEVKMPCSQSSIIPDPNNVLDGSDKTISRWELIENSLKSGITDSFDLEEAILKYNHHYRNHWNFDVLHHYFEQCGEEDKNTFFMTTLPKMIKLALSLPKLFTKAIPFLKQREVKKLTFTQHQVACLLANAFFCTFPRRNKTTSRSGSGSHPSINFSSMFGYPQSPQRVSKLKCILHYFERVTKNMPKGVVTYSRHILQNKNKNWSDDQSKLTKLHLSSTGTIEDKGRDMLQADFANKCVGGGVLGHGCVQEEIRFLICPEMIISRLFTEVLLDDEVLVMTGCERFSSYSGYAQTFQWKEDFQDLVERDEWGRKYTEVVAMDALSIKRHMNQFEKHLVLRELNKAYCAFEAGRNDRLPAVCTGNWGCGAFGGNPELKALIQVMAASVAKRDVCYLSVGNQKLCQDLSKIYDACHKENLVVADLFSMIMDFSKRHPSPGRYSSVSLFEFIKRNMAIPQE